MGRRNLLLAAGVTALLAGCEGPTVPARMAPYEFDRDGLVFHWPRDRLPVRYWVEPAGNLPRYIADGLRIWEAQLLYGEFYGTLVDDSLSADVIVRLEGGAPPAGTPTGTVPPRNACETAVTTYPATDPAGRLEGPLRILLRWKPGTAPAVTADCLVMLSAHELGHTLGLRAHSDGDDDLMLPNPQTLTPSARDRITVQTLYRTTPTIYPKERPR